MGLPGKPFTNKIGTMIDDDINGRVEELEKENKRLALQNEVLSGAYETSQRRVKELETEKAELLEVLQMAWPYIHDWETDNVDDRECGLFRDNQLAELYDKINGVLKEQCPQIQDAQ